MAAARSLPPRAVGAFVVLAGVPGIRAPLFVQASLTLTSRPQEVANMLMRISSGRNRALAYRRPAVLICDEIAARRWNAPRPSWRVALPPDARALHTTVPVVDAQVVAGRYLFNR
jgi:hypothetical protein